MARTLKGRSLVNRLSATPARRRANADVDWAAWVADIEREAFALARKAVAGVHRTSESGIVIREKCLAAIDSLMEPDSAQGEAE